MRHIILLDEDEAIRFDRGDHIPVNLDGIVVYFGRAFVNPHKREKEKREFPCQAGCGKIFGTKMGEAVHRAKHKGKKVKNATPENVS